MQRRWLDVPVEFLRSLTLLGLVNPNSEERASHTLTDTFVLGDRSRDMFYHANS